MPSCELGPEMKRPLVIHHFLAAACPILFLTAHNIQEVSVYQAVVPLALVIAISLVLWVLAHRLTGDSMRGALIVSLFWILFFSYGYVHELSMGAVVGDVPIGRHRYLLSLWMLVLIAVSYLVVRTRRDLQMVSRWLNFTGRWTVRARQTAGCSRSSGFDRRQCCRFRRRHHEAVAPSRLRC